MIMQRTTSRFVLALLAPLTSAVALAAGESITLAEAKQAAEAAVAYARSHNAPGGAIAITDSGGQIVYLERLDGSFPASGAISIGKARTAALFQKPTKVFEDIVNNGRTTMVALPEITPFTPLQGGVPLVRNGIVVGAIGVSGAASAQQDNEIAEAAAQAFATAKAAAVSYFPADAVNSAFRANQTLLDTEGFRVNPSRRDGPGEAEVHLWDGDIMYITEGSATIVTGGQVTEPKTTAPGEIRGPRIEGGTPRKIAAGDVIHIPAGVPHWFQAVKTPFTYYVIKDTDRSAS
jgi:glc operon protein GlcG